jgi:protein involved in polysaccharide export with SLBB domain
MNSINCRKSLFKISKVIFVIFLTYSCTYLPGINKGIKSQKSTKKITGYYSIDDITVDIIDINKLDENQINNYNKSQINKPKYSIKEFSNIYNYQYAYALGSADTIKINLTDTDDLDNIYLIDQNGMIDLPFVGKVKLNDLTLNQAHNLLKQLVSDFYKNPDLQIKIEEFNSSKVYILGAVEKQISIKLDQNPITLIEAAIKANFKPASSSKNFGTKGFLRRDNQVYKIDLFNAFKSIDKKENFFLKKDDVVFIDQNSDAIHIFGEVGLPGLYFPNLDYSLTTILSIARLNNLTANAKNIYVIREKFNKFLEVDVFVFDARNPINMIAGRKLKMQEKDIVFVPPSKIVNWNRTISLLLPQTDLFSSYNPIIQTGVKSNSNLTE